LAQQIKEELNSYKMEEMEVHAASRIQYVISFLLLDVDGLDAIFFFLAARNSLSDGVFLFFFDATLPHITPCSLTHTHILSMAPSSEMPLQCRHVQDQISHPFLSYIFS